MRKRISVEYEGRNQLTTTWTQDETASSMWHWRTTDQYGNRLDGGDVDSTSALYMLWEHMHDPRAKFTAGEV
jgi:hypothetical protein